MNFYASVFILFELSSPFNNIHWFLDKLHLTGSTYQWINGIILIITFFCCRLVWGAFNSYWVFSDIWQAIQHGRLIGDSDLGLKLGLGQSVPATTAEETAARSPRAEIMQFAGDQSVPLWLATSYLLSNIVLNCLNYYWMGKMIETIRKRFDPPFGTKGVGEEKEKVQTGQIDGKPAEIEVQRGLYGDGRKTLEVEGREVRNRRRG